MIESNDPIDAIDALDLEATEIDAIADPTESCAVCSAVPVGERYVLAHAASLAVFCSEPCLRAGLRAQWRRRWAARRRRALQLSAVVVFVGACLTPHGGPSAARPRRPLRQLAVAAPAGPPPLPDGWFGPDWPPTETNLLAALGRDAWVHPLAGPFRRMPLRDSRVFGAPRPGNRAVECRNGHCGVDLGGEIWGEHVHAVHDGVVEWIQRGPNPQHGGQYVRIAHRGGTVVTQYFHLAAIPRELERGTPVKGGDVVGLLGDTGVKESAPHLHFSISIRPPDRPERYMDPEPLVALWPLRVPVEGTEVGLVTTTARPGLPLGSAPLSAGRRRKLARQGRAPATDTADGEGASPSGDEAAGPPEAPSAPESSPDE